MKITIIGLVLVDIDLDDPRYCDGCSELWIGPSPSDPRKVASCEITLTDEIKDDGDHFIRPNRCMALENLARKWGLST